MRLDFDFTMPFSRIRVFVTLYSCEQTSTMQDSYVFNPLCMHSYHISLFFLFEMVGCHQLGFDFDP